MMCEDKLCHHSEWNPFENSGSRECLSPDTHPYILVGMNTDSNVYYFCNLHSPTMSNYKRITPEEALVFRVLKE